MTGPGLRARKKQQTREAIIGTAQRLFFERGFDDVTVADIAKGAEVAEGTVFNYFGTKEDLFFSGMEAYEDRLIAAVRDRAESQSVMDAFRDVVIDGSRQLASRGDAQGAALGAKLMSESSSLRKRELEIVADYTRTLAQMLAADLESTDLDITPYVAANALIGVHRALVDLVRRLAIDGVSGADIASRVAEEAENGFTALSDGLADYGRR
jgi:AcrR family transcriptional regulator